MVTLTITNSSHNNFSNNKHHFMATSISNVVKSVATLTDRIAHLSKVLKNLKQMEANKDGQGFGNICEGIMGNATPGIETTKPVDKRIYFKSKVFIGNISFKVSPAQLKTFLSKFGDVTNIHIINNRARRTSKRIGFATFANAEMASKAIMAKPEDLQLSGREIRICPAEKTRSKKKLQDAPLDLLDKDNFSDSSSVNIRNDYVLQHILTYLNIKELLAVESVCKRWKRIVDSVWASCHSLKFSKHSSIFSSNLSDDLLEKILLRCPNLKALHLEDDVHSLTSRTADIISNLCCDLETLKLKAIDITAEGLQLISENCPNLKILCLKRCNNIEKEGFWHLMTNCQSLEYFEVDRNSSITEKCLENVSPNLKGLSVSACPRFEEWRMISSKCKNLQTLKLKYATHAMTDVQLKDILESCIYIEDFELVENFYMEKSYHLMMNNRPLSSQGLLHLTNLNHLKCLNLYDQAAVSDEVLIAVSKNCHALCTLDVSKCTKVTDSGVDSLKLLPNLQHLGLNVIVGLTSGPLKAIAARGQLVTLSMVLCRINDISGPVQVLALCPNMVALNIANNSFLTTAMVTECINAVKGREQTHKLTISCGGCGIEREALSLVPPYIDIDWESYWADYELDEYEEMYSYSDLYDD